jgi:FixJ family two-component response regulator
MVHVVNGLLNKQVAASLGTSEKTIKVHRARVMHKMGATSLAQLVRMADRLGLTSQEQLEPESPGAPRRTSSH